MASRQFFDVATGTLLRMAKTLPSPDQIGNYWVTGLSGATQKISDGVDRVTQAPGVAAAAQADVWANNVAAAKQKFIDNSRRVSLSEWQTATKAAVGNVATGAQRKQQKFITAITPVLSHIAAGQGKLANMPRGSYAQNVQRMTTFVDHMHNYKRPAGS